MQSPSGDAEKAIKVKSAKRALLTSLMLVFIFSPVHPQSQSVPSEPGGNEGVLITCTGAPQVVLNWLVERGIGLWIDNRSLSQGDCGRTVGVLTITFPPNVGIPPLQLPNASGEFLLVNITPGSLVASPPGVGVEEVYCRHSVYPLHLYYLKINSTLTWDALLAISDKEEGIARRFVFPHSLLQRAYSSKGYTPIPPAACSSPLPQLVLLKETYFLIARTPSGPLVVVGEPSVIPSNQTPFPRIANSTASPTVRGNGENPPTVNGNEVKEVGVPPPLHRETVRAVETPPSGSAGEGGWGVSRVGLARAFIVIGIVLLILGILGRGEERG